MPITPDSQAILLLCSHLGLPEEADPAPLTLRRWNSLARRLVDRSLHPQALLGLSAADIANSLDLQADESERLARLLARGGSLAIELERLESLGIWVWTRADEAYPTRLRKRLQEAAPPILFGAGDRYLPGQPGLAIVGSRNVDEAGQAMAEFVGNACAYCGLVVVSGGARGVDAFSMKAALEGRGMAVGVLAHSLEKAIRSPAYRTALGRGDLTLLTPYAPQAGFSVGAAMGRNKLIYALADYALVIASDANKGGTWAGATEALKRKWAPVFVVKGKDAPDGNLQLLNNGAIPFPDPFKAGASELATWLREHSAGSSPAQQLKLM